MTDRLTTAELEALPAKSRRDPAVVALYREHDYLTAYGLHTDRRVRMEGYAPAAGADASRDNWDSHGALQRDFLVRVAGLKPWDYLLDFGCGGGRLARQVTAYLEPGHYHGVDLSAAALEAARGLARLEGWGERAPTFWLREIQDSGLRFDLVWAHSVFTHLPPELIVKTMCDVSQLLKPGGAFYWTYLPATETVRYGLTQFRATEVVLRECAERARLSMTEIPDWVRRAGHMPGRWAGEQLLAMSHHRC